jgi:hypothetical protein
MKILADYTMRNDRGIASENDFKTFSDANAYQTINSILD